MRNLINNFNRGMQYVVQKQKSKHKLHSLKLQLPPKLVRRSIRQNQLRDKIKKSEN